MRHAYVRFVTPDLDEDSGRRRGVFQAIADLAFEDDHQIAAIPFAETAT